ncbi:MULTISPECIES: MarR family winged helix-turn-helix transcriptional regulator [Pseudomonadaceae]|uniref:MarR family winged helix-turn-helix transcriptional regulator n=1 Tax=unclassified Pseudomonas TaxID=196821 RepID=UPI0012F29F99|nr:MULTISPECIES: MarR family transcriptional regulator [Pseudomonas]MDZ4191458.1 MarR family transcriptional regulator [Pseudomonas sp.]UZT80463.1 MarR family transcriptional regulator [Pseudomonas chengduensis]VXB59114.1 MarR family transcriptional regulator [Pseudomonas sp. 8O]
MTDLKNFPEKFLTSPAEGTQAGRHGSQVIKNAAAQQAAMEAFFFGYQAFTAKPDEMLAKRGLSRVHHRILFFIAKYPGLNMTELLGYLGVSKQALNMPLRQLIEMNLVQSEAAADDKRKRVLGFTAEGAKLEQALRREQARLLQRVFGEMGEEAVQGWLEVNHALARSRQERT